MRTRTVRYGLRSCRILEAQIWNTLHSHLKDVSNNYKQFMSGLKTLLFVQGSSENNTSLSGATQMLDLTDYSETITKSQ